MCARASRDLSGPSCPAAATFFSAECWVGLTANRCHSCTPNAGRLVLSTQLLLLLPPCCSCRYDQDEAYDFLKKHGLAARAFGEQSAAAHGALVGAAVREGCCSSCAGAPAGWLDWLGMQSELSAPAA